MPAGQWVSSRTRAGTPARGTRWCPRGYRPDAGSPFRLPPRDAVGFLDEGALVTGCPARHEHGQCVLDRGNHPRHRSVEVSTTGPIVREWDNERYVEPQAAGKRTSKTKALKAEIETSLAAHQDQRP
jgi:hypothetical protein